MEDAPHPCPKNILGYRAKTKVCERLGTDEARSKQKNDAFPISMPVEGDDVRQSGKRNPMKRRRRAKA